MGQDRMLVLGDELSDDGGQEAGAEEGEMDSYGFGSCTNGPNWAHYLAQRLRIPSLAALFASTGRPLLSDPGESAC